ncbi:SWI/SNF complex subunit SWI3A [Humulus lupulus]|uniref:SWI/SNF complex subunit SWI3A n=1 Tax=Humulus lupulus TaxID=3486 RepID=UPI002B40BB5B|nr:SWI/SNF complex subunit SWI3A [Humulus lupulus]
MSQIVNDSAWSEMEQLAQQDPDPHHVRPEQPELDLYTIPSHSSWFLWDEIHDTERIYLKEFFDGSSFSRTPKIYKEYRDFIINKYREDPSKRLTFTEVRKSLVGDVNLLHRVFLFLEKWGLINLGASSGDEDGSEVLVEEGSNVKIEEGVPNGIRVVAMPNSIKPITAQATLKNKTEPVDNGVKLPPLSSYTDLFADLMKQKELVCGNCGDRCTSGYYKCTEGDFLNCTKCFQNESYGENKSVEGYTFIESIQDSGHHEAVWNESETLLLLESVMKYGDDWELVAQNVPTKTKLDCIAKLIELPLGEILGSATHKKVNSKDVNGNLNSSKQVESISSENQEIVNTGEQQDEKTHVGEQNGDTVEHEPPLKRQRIDPLSSLGGSLMKQVALLSTEVGHHITAAAAEAAVTALCEEISCPRELFYGDDDSVTNELQTLISDTERVLEVEDSKMEGGPTQSDNHGKPVEKDDIPLTLRVRTAVATALGAAAARAKLLADQEEREIEHLVATIVGSEMKKLHCKIKHFEDLEVMMKKKHAEMEEMEDILLEERINVLQQAFTAGIPRWKDHPIVKS